MFKLHVTLNYTIFFLLGSLKLEKMIIVISWATVDIVRLSSLS